MAIEPISRNNREYFRSRSPATVPALRRCDPLSVGGTSWCADSSAGSPGWPIVLASAGVLLTA